MSTAYVVVTVVAAAMAGFSAASVLLGAEWVLKPPACAAFGLPPPVGLRRIRPPASRPPAPTGVLGLSPP
jgi:hypothetical protein